MKKIFFILSIFALFIAVAIFNPKESYAQTFICEWHEAINECDYISNTCTGDCVPNPNICASRSGNASNCCNDGSTDDGCLGTYPCECPVGSGSSPIDWATLYTRIGQHGSPPFMFSLGLTIGTIINALLDYIFPFAGLLLIFYLIYGGFMFLTSGGDPNKVQVAKGVITTASIGFIIIFTSYWIVQIVGSVLGLSEITDIF